MANRYAEDIRRIAKIDEAKGGLADATERDGIAGVRGVAYFNDSGSVVGVSGAPSETLAPETTISETIDGQVSDSDSQITSENDGTEDAADVLDGTLDLGDQLKEITAEDCESGTSMKIRTDAEFVPPAEVTVDDTTGTPITLNIAWSDADTPPEQQGFFLGFEFSTGSPGAVAEYGVHATNVAALYAHIAGYTADNPGTFTGGFVFDEVSTLDSSGYGVNVNLDAVVGLPILQTFIGSSSACTPGSSTSCPLTAPLEENWPVQSQEFSFIHTFRDGKFISNIYDSLLPTDHIADLAEIDFCNDTDSRVGRIEPTSNGGFMISERDGVGGASLGQYQVFSTDGTLVDFVGEATADLLRPSP